MRLIELRVPQTISGHQRGIDENTPNADLIVQDNGLTWTLGAGTDRGLRWLQESTGTEEPEIELEAEHAKQLCERARLADLQLDSSA